MIYKVGILGITGRMGEQISQLFSPHYALKEDLFELAEGVSQSRKLSSVEKAPVRSLEETPREPVHVWIDFSNPEATVKLLEQIHTPLVIGTTGFSDYQLNKIREYATQQPVLLAPNMSPGICLMTKILESLKTAKTLGFETVLSESHHRMKKDSPSGTAKALAQTLKDSGFSDFPIQVTRAGGEKGLHRVTFYSDEEELTIEHRVVERSVFAKGALLGARFLLKTAKPGLYQFKDVEAE